MAVGIEGDPHHIFATGQRGQVRPSAVNALNRFVIDIKISMACGGATLTIDFSRLKSKVSRANVEVPALHGVGINANSYGRNGRARRDFERSGMEYVVIGIDPFARRLRSRYAFAVSANVSSWLGLRGRGCTCASGGFCIGRARSTEGATRIATASGEERGAREEGRGDDSFANLISSHGGNLYVCERIRKGGMKLPNIL